MRKRKDYELPLNIRATMLRALGDEVTPPPLQTNEELEAAEALLEELKAAKKELDDADN